LNTSYVDLFYHHRPDPETPLEETLSALVTAVQSGKALYVGVSNYPAELIKEASKWMKDAGVPLIVNQTCYNLFDREVEKGVLSQCQKRGLGFVAFSPLAQGILTDRYLKGIPADSRIASQSETLQKDDLTAHRIDQIQMLNDVAKQRGQSLAQMALSWCVHDQRVTSVLIGASRVEQIKNCLGILDAKAFSEAELDQIDVALGLKMSITTGDE
ncbi:MAG: aldo/keto reductase, partial [Verrucomicrobiota bacterium]